mmetsp:Transcript_1080/g.2104  ORF Transcript_1080/g.2104 Transcript_1080/m.2104 type:complete len:124 (+) Transcript_1080:242-613(+)
MGAQATTGNDSTAETLPAPTGTQFVTGIVWMAVWTGAYKACRTAGEELPAAESCIPRSLGLSLSETRVHTCAVVQADLQGILLARSRFPFSGRSREVSCTLSGCSGRSAGHPSGDLTLPFSGR